MLPPSGQISKLCRTYSRRGDVNSNCEGLWKEATAGANVPWLSRSVAGISPQKSGFDPRPVRVEYVVDKVAGQVPSPQDRTTSISPVSIIPAMLCTYSVIYTPKLCYLKNLQ
jgi:hypothetical protein